MSTRMCRFILTALLIVCVRSWAQEEDERVYVSSCSLFVKITPYTPDSGDVSGKAMIEATLSDKSGIPIPDQEIKLTATCGTLSCLSLDNIGMSGAVSSGRSCFVTDKDGKIQVFLIDIPFNRPGRVKAACIYGNFKVHASCSFSITRKIIKKWNRNKSSLSTQSTTR
ncbi:MAG: hypothetical protein ABSF80_11615 [Chitinispirillaceae bacterium]